MSAARNRHPRARNQSNPFPRRNKYPYGRQRDTALRTRFINGCVYLRSKIGRIRFVDQSGCHRHAPTIISGSARSLVRLAERSQSSSVITFAFARSSFASWSTATSGNSSSSDGTPLQNDISDWVRWHPGSTGDRSRPRGFENLNRPGLAVVSIHAPAARTRPTETATFDRSTRPLWFREPQLTEIHKAVARARGPEP